MPELFTFKKVQLKLTGEEGGKGGKLENSAWISAGARLQLK